MRRCPIFLLACVAQAALLPAGASAQIEEVVVTARRIEERLQDVPTAITAFGPKELEDRQIQSVLDLGASIPSVMIVHQNGTPGMPQFAIRGVTAGTLLPEVDSPIALYVDGVYLARNVGAIFDLADLERIEVMRGPQGTLFGRNAEAGALHFITAAPTGKWGAHVEGTLGNHDQRRVKATLNTAEFGGLSVRATVLHSRRDGFVKNSMAGTTILLPEPFGPQKTPDTVGVNKQTAAMLAARYQTDRLQLDYKFDFTDQRAQAEPSQVLGFDTGQIGALVFQLQPGGPAAFGTAPLNPNASLAGIDHMRVLGHSLTAQWDVDDTLSLKSISAWRHQWNSGGFNTNEGVMLVAPAALASAFGWNEGDLICMLCSNAKRPQHQISEELQLIGRREGLDWIVGGFYFREKGFQNNITYILKSFPQVAPGVYTAGPLTPADFANGSLNHARNSSLAGYAHFTAHFGDDLDIAGGIRYTRDKRSAAYWTTTITDVPGAESFPLADGTPGPGRFSKVFTHTDYEGTVTYHFTPDVNVYGRVASGYVAGGVLHGAPYKPTTNTTYEAGLKSDWFGRRARFNLTVFRQDQTDLQVLQFRPGLGQFLVNTGDNRTYGLEMEASVVPVDGVTLSASLGHLSFRKLGGARIAQPKTNLSLTAEYNTPKLSNGMYGSLRFDGTYLSRFTFQAIPLLDQALDASTFTRSSWELGLRASVLDIPTGYGTGRVSLWSRNLTDVRRISYVANFGIYVPGTFNHPRTWGVDLAFDF